MPKFHGSATLVGAVCALADPPPWRSAAANVPAFAGPNCLLSSSVVTLLLLVSYRIVDGIPTAVDVLSVALALLF
jgi:hypothetical protein